MRRIVTSLGCCLVLLCSVTAMAASSTVVISQFRTRLAGSATDEFVELYNLGSAPVNISGWKLRYSSSGGTFAERVTIGSVILAPQSHFLMTISGTTYTGGTPTDQTWASSAGLADACGIGLADASGTLIDAVSTVLTVPYVGYREGTGLAAMTSGGTTKAYLRKTPVDGCGPSQDTDDNATDFVAVTTTPVISNHSSCRLACATGDSCVWETVCTDATTSTSYVGSATCPGGTGPCVYTPTATTCEFGCTAAGTGLCNPDPCLGITCDTAPDACHSAAGTCALGVCDYPVLVDGTCDDLDPCTDSDTCDAAGACAGTAKACDTPPDAQCYAAGGICVAGTCQYTPLDDPTLCDDGNSCTDLDACDPAHTCAGTLRSCPPKSPTCEPGDVSRSYLNGQCSPLDGLCGYVDSDTSCLHGCDAASGLCQGDPCAGVVCLTPPSACHKALGTCDLGVCAYDLNPGADCNDADACTTTDKCQADGSCAGTAVACTTPLNSQCYEPTGACDAGQCLYTAKLEGVPCDDGDACTDTDACTAGHACTGTPKVCDTPPNAQCWEATGTCTAGQCGYTQKATGALCDDGNLCTDNDACTADQACAGTLLVCPVPAPTCAEGTAHLFQSACDVADGICKDSLLADVPCGSGCGTGFCNLGVVISEFRTRGPAGGNDEFYEFYNAGETEVDLSGWTLAGSNNTGSSISTRITFAAGTRMPPKSFLLAVNLATLGYSGTVVGDASSSTGISDNGGLALKDASGAVVDQVGMAVTSGFKEGNTLTPLATAQTTFSFRRKTAVCGPDQDSGDNVRDFVLVTDPSPQNSKSCRPACAGDLCPDRVTCSDATTSATLTAGNCAADVCTWTATPTTCPATCLAATGECADLCAGATCDTPPNSQCYQPAGTCVPADGTCQYTAVAETTGCDDGDLCTTVDQCTATQACVGTAVFCTLPVPACQTDGSSRTFSNGACNAADGTCLFDHADAPCTHGCNAASGLCNGDPCTDVVCDTPPATVCADADTSRTFAATGICESAGGTCEYDAADAACADGCDETTGLCKDNCLDVTCDTPPSACHAATGTCSNGQCSYEPLQATVACDDLDSCTLDDHCDGQGTCVAGTQNPACEDLGSDATGDTATPDVPVSETGSETGSDTGVDPGTEMGQPDPGPDSVTNRDIPGGIDLGPTGDNLTLGGGGGCAAGSGVHPTGLLAGLLLFLGFALLRRKRSCQQR